MSDKKEKVVKKVKTDSKLQKIVDEVSTLSVMELSELVKALEDKLGVQAMAATPAAAAPVAGDQAAPAAEEKSEFDVVLASAGSNKIAVIKAIREIKPDLGLKDAKDLADAAPKEILEGAKKEAAEEAKEKLEAAGAQVELK